VNITFTSNIDWDKSKNTARVKVGGEDYDFSLGTDGGRTLTLTLLPGRYWKDQANQAITVSGLKAANGDGLVGQDNGATEVVLADFGTGNENIFKLTNIWEGSSTPKAQWKIKDRTSPIVLTFNQNINAARMSILRPVVVTVGGKTQPALAAGFRTDYRTYDAEFAGATLTLTPKEGNLWPVDQNAESANQTIFTVWFSVEIESELGGDAGKYGKSGQVGHRATPIEIAYETLSDLFLVTAPHSPQSDWVNKTNANKEGVWNPVTETFDDRFVFGYAANSKAEPVVLTFSEAIDVEKLKTNGTAGDRDYVTVSNGQILDLSFSADGKTLTIKPKNGSDWDWRLWNEDNGSYESVNDLLFTVKGIFAASDQRPITDGWTVKDKAANDGRGTPGYLISLYRNVLPIEAPPKIEIDTTTGHTFLVPSFNVNDNVYIKWKNLPEVPLTNGDANIQKFYDIYLDTSSGTQNPYLLFSDVGGLSKTLPAAFDNAAWKKANYHVSEYGWVGTSDTIWAKVHLANSLKDNQGNLQTPGYWNINTADAYGNDYGDGNLWYGRTPVSRSLEAWRIGWVRDSVILYARAKNDAGESEWSNGQVVKSQPTIRDYRVERINFGSGGGYHATAPATVGDWTIRTNATPGSFASQLSAWNNRTPEVRYTRGGVSSTNIENIGYGSHSITFDYSGANTVQGVLNTDFTPLFTPTTGNYYTASLAATAVQDFDFPFARVTWYFNQPMWASNGTVANPATAQDTLRGELAGGKVRFETTWNDWDERRTTFYRVIKKAGQYQGWANPVDPRGSKTVSFVQWDKDLNDARKSAIGSLVAGSDSVVYGGWTPPATFLAGENGVGNITVLGVTAIACHIDSIACQIRIRNAVNGTTLYLYGLASTYVDGSGTVGDPGYIAPYVTSETRVYAYTKVSHQRDAGDNTQVRYRNAETTAAPFRWMPSDGYRSWIGTSATDNKKGEPWYVYEGTGGNAPWYQTNPDIIGGGKTISRGPVAYSVYYDTRSQSGYPVLLVGDWNVTDHGPYAELCQTTTASTAAGATPVASCGFRCSNDTFSADPVTGGANPCPVIN
jgi:hypothetical protein